MGNQLTAIAPSQILPAEQYLNDIPNIEYIKNLGSTRFFKVVKAKTKEGLVVVKIFVLHDPTLQLKSYENQIEEIKNKLDWALNCKPFQCIIKSERAVMLLRQYIQYSLYDRISTRPFFSLIEKKWIAFLLLCAVGQSHKLNIYHGDIKSENILITSWNWLILSDFANFKPVFLPDNNPADFSFYFDTSRRRTCNIAPERFINGVYKLSDQPCSNSFDISTENFKGGELTEAMDVFSTGCVLIELFTEGMVPFDLSQLLAYICGEYSPENIVKNIEDPGICELVNHMIQKEPNQRDSIENYLNKHRGTTFPECFYDFLRPYCQRFSCTPLLYADERIARIHRDFDLIIQKTEFSSQNENFLIILPLIISCVRKLKLCESKLVTLDLLKRCSYHVNSDIILDRLIPYVLFFINDTFSIVRSETINTLLHCLKMVTFIPDSDINIFTEYIFPLISPLTSDKDLSVRIRFAKHISHFAEESVRFLELSKQNEKQIKVEKWHNKQNKNSNKDYTYESSTSSYDEELSILHDFIQQKVVAILGDKSNAVKQAIMHDSINQLCVFFGRQRANDVIFSHIITFLNDKEDWQLRAAFFKSMTGVVSYLGRQASIILSPLLQQGLNDKEEFVVQQTIESFSSLLEMEIMKKSIILENVNEIVPMLIHPNQWIRSKSIGVVIQLSKKMDIVDFNCYVLPALKPYFVEVPQDFEDEMLLLHLLKNPLSRQVYQQLTNGKFNVDSFLAFLNKPNSLVNKTENEPNVILMRKLYSMGMTDIDVENIKLMQRNILNQYKVKKSELPNQNNSGYDKFNGIIHLTSSFDSETSIVHSIDFVNSVSSGLTGFSKNVVIKGKRAMNKATSSEMLTMNDDWEQMFGNNKKQSSPSYPIQNPINNTLIQEKLSHIESSSSLQLLAVQNQQVEKETTTNSQKDTHKCIKAACKTDLEDLLISMKSQHNKESKDTFYTEERPILNDWRPYGIMVAHLHEHRGAINRLRVSRNNRFFASCSNDGSVKVWDVSGLDGKSITNRSRFTYNKQAGQIKTFCFSGNSSMIASASDTGSIHVFNADCSQSKTETILSKDIDITSNGLIVDMNAYDLDSENVISFVTVHGLIIGWDLRMPHKYAWQIESDPKCGLITSFDLHRHSNWIITGSSNGHHTVWDMRFQLPINHFTHPQKSRVKRVVVDQFSQSRVISSTQGNNEVTLWDVETTAKHKVLWVSPTPYLSNSTPTRHSVTNFYYNPNYVITAGTDMRLRFWDLSQPSYSYIIAGSSMDSAEEINSCISYNSQLIEATQVIHEYYKPAKRPSSSSSSPRSNTNDLNYLNEETAYTQEVQVGHRDLISDIAVCNLSQPFIISSSRDGVIKIWK